MIFKQRANAVYCCATLHGPIEHKGPLMITTKSFPQYLHHHPQPEQSHQSNQKPVEAHASGAVEEGGIRLREDNQFLGKALTLLGLWNNSELGEIHTIVFPLLFVCANYKIRDLER
jgi:hypothetical protein